MAEDVSIGIYLLCYAGAMIVTVCLVVVLGAFFHLWDKWKRK